MDNKETKIEMTEIKEHKEEEKLFNTDRMTLEQKKNYMHKMKNKIDDITGYFYWKKYIASAFWSNLSTPINLTITLLTALMTAQATTKNLLSETMYTNISVANLLISVLNTFFRPHSKLASSIDSLAKWNALGCKFEIINAMSSYTEEQIDIKIERYSGLLLKINEYREKESPDNINFLTDLIFLIALKCCLKDKYLWSNLDSRPPINSSINNNEHKS